MPMTATEAARLDIDLAAVVANWRTLAARHAGATAGVVKADAYGLGAARVAPALAAAGCRHFFVAHLAEAIALRPLIGDAFLAVLNGPVPGAEPAYRAHAITPVLGDLASLARWRDSGGGPAILHVDTGMSRLGLDEADWSALQATPSLRDGVPLAYVMTHLVSSEDPADPINETQQSRFAAIAAALPGVPTSFANSSGLFLDGCASDLARPGAALYGINPTPSAPNPMRPTVRLRARVLQIRAIPPGEPVGYNATWRATRPTRIATAGIGYADGYPRSLSNRGAAFFDGARLPLVGRVSMDLTTFDATDVPGLAPGDWLDLIGPDLPVDAVAEAAGTNDYEILTRLGPRYVRTYTG